MFKSIKRRLCIHVYEAHHSKCQPKTNALICLCNQQVYILYMTAPSPSDFFVQTSALLGHNALLLSIKLIAVTLIPITPVSTRSST